MRCPNCNREYQGGACPGCGAKQYARTQEIFNSAQNEESGGLTPLWRTWWFWLLIALSILGLGLMIFANAESKRQALRENQATEESVYNELRTDEPTAYAEPMPPAEEIDPGGGAANAAELPSIPETVLLEQDGIRVVASRLSQDGWLGPDIEVLLENSSDKTVTVQVRDVSVNGAMLSPLFSCDVPAGGTGNGLISLFQSDLDTAGIRVIRSIELSVIALDAESLATISKGDAVTIKTDAEGVAQSFDDSGFAALDENGLRLVVRGVREEGSAWGKDVLVYLENNTGRDVTVQLRGASVNGYSMEPFFSCFLAEGKVAYSSISFTSEDLDENGIQKIESLTFSVALIDPLTWGLFFQSDPVTVPFPF